jgi:septal ring factor EnvC (AmiA/AmiB activator)
VPYTEKTFHVLRIAFMFICVIAAAAVGIGAYVVWHQHDQIQEQARDIQIQRYDTAFRNCSDQNKRHDRTIRTLRKEIRHLSPKRREAAQRRHSLRNTIRLIDALVPRRDCIHVARLAITQPPVTPPLVKPLPTPITTRG